MGLHLRRLLPETARPDPGHAVLAELLARHRAKLLIGALTIMGGTASTYVNIFFMPTYLIRMVGLPPQTAFLTGCVAGATMLAVASAGRASFGSPGPAPSLRRLDRAGERPSPPAGCGLP
ncbi:hypothetical protein [Azospirillum sp. INR13]|uniref:hypothetical protein n=1 Tax=Azospirillum sp. INR13 TaxID=2596919 RepID=UPI0018921920|nr:hypothetical protein [Azospirillum sp. INR13]